MGAVFEDAGEEYDEELEVMVGEEKELEEEEAEYWVEGGLWLFCISTCIMLCISSTRPSIWSSVRELVDNEEE